MILNNYGYAKTSSSLKKISSSFLHTSLIANSLIIYAPFPT